MRSQILSGEPPLPPVLAIEHADLRAQIRPDTSGPFHGRHTMRLMLPAGGASVVVPVPLTAKSFGVEGGPVRSQQLCPALEAAPIRVRSMALCCRRPCHGSRVFGRNT